MVLGLFSQLMSSIKQNEGGTYLEVHNTGLSHQDGRKRHMGRRMLLPMAAGHTMHSGILVSYAGYTVEYTDQERKNLDCLLPLINIEKWICKNRHMGQKKFKILTGHLFFKLPHLFFTLHYFIQQADLALFPGGRIGFGYKMESTLPDSTGFLSRTLKLV